MKNIQKIIKSGRTLDEALIIKDHFQQIYYRKHIRGFYEMEINRLKELPFYKRQEKVWNRYVSRWYGVK